MSIEFKYREVCQCQVRTSIYDNHRLRLNWKQAEEAERASPAFHHFHQRATLKLCQQKIVADLTAYSVVRLNRNDSTHNKFQCVEDPF